MFRLQGKKNDVPDLMRDVFQWDVRNWSGAADLWAKHLKGKHQLNCLEIGSHQGGLSLWLALQGHKILCTDLESPMLRALDLHKNYDVLDLVSYAALDALELKEKDHYDVIIFKSVLGGVGRDERLDRQQAMIAAIYRALKPGGVLLFAENLRASKLHQWGSWRYPTLLEVEQLLGEFSSFELKTAGFAGAFGRGETSRRVLSVFDQFGFNHITRSSHRYIVFGVGVK
jgi:SAM-dependent methyltransferase